MTVTANGPMQRILEDLRARQSSGEHMPCPRCGLDNMKADLSTHRKSLYVDVKVCDDCAEQEAGVKEMNIPLGAMRLDYACFKYGIGKEAVGDLTVAEIQKRIEGGQIEHLLDFFEAVSNSPDDVDALWASYETMRKCPGIVSINWVEPSAEYAARNGRVVVRFRWREGNLEYAIDAK